MMKKVRNIAVFFLLFIFILFSIGFKVNYHVCNISGERFLSVYYKSSCEEHSQEKSIPEKKSNFPNSCCDDLTTNNSQKSKTGTSKNSCDIRQSDECCYEYSKDHVLNLTVTLQTQPELKLDVFTYQKLNEELYTSLKIDKLNHHTKIIKNEIFDIPRKMIIAFIYYVSNLDKPRNS